MKKKLIPIVTLICALFLQGCETLKPAGKVTQEAINLNYYWVEGSIINFIDTVDLTEEESETIIKALISAENVRQNMFKYYNNPEGVIKDINKIQLDYLNLRYQYIEVRSIILKHRETYSAEAWDLFVRFDKHANALDESFEELRGNISTNAQGLQMLSVASSMLKLIAVL